ncbi:MAG: iron-containing alcohol dehydrogenase [Myxococcota bacterium]|jgi:glycerol-1-phosphate dehydrogenase [NAD(P)+]|nr:iron-containing alcohol dehydrogenase [Myxococcota bacterium]
MFEKYCGMEAMVDGRLHAISTRAVLCERQLLSRVAPACRDLFVKEGPVLLVVDRKTYEVAGAAVEASFAAASVPTVLCHVLEPAQGAAVADDANVAHVEQALRAGQFAYGVAIGAGTVNDILKLASDRVGVDYAVVGTAPSMNGFSSALAAILSKGVKTTVSCHAPLAVFFDVDVMAAAPYRMIASGLGDLLSRAVSIADWRLGARLFGERFNTLPLPLLEDAQRELEGVAQGLPQRSPEAIRGLCNALALSGMAMAIAGSSSPASGGEHLISHYLDMVAIAQHEEHDFHGCQVGVASVLSARFYEWLGELELEGVDFERLVARHVPWSVYEKTVAQRFSPYNLSHAVLEHAQKKYPDRPTLRARFAHLREDWEAIIEELRQSARSSAWVSEQLSLAQAPRSFAEIGVSAARAQNAVLHAKDIRARYTILDLVSELGLLESWTEDALAPDGGLSGEGD